MILLTNRSHWAKYLQMTLRSVIQIRIQCSWKMLLIMIWMKWIYGKKKKWLMSFNPDKKEIMILSNRSMPENLYFSFIGKSVPITTSHKHLSATFSNDAKWNTYVDNIQSSVSKHLNILRLSRTNLDKLYLVYIRPLFEYACELWDNCGIGNSQKLEQLQLEATRIVTGLPIFTKTEILYIETGWELLSVRRKRRKLQLFFYIIVNKNTPNYLCTLIPPTMQSTSVYPLRNWYDIILPFCRLSSTRDSVIPSTIKMWNSLNNTIRNVDTLSKFESELKKIDETENHAVLKHYLYDPRKLNIILTS